MNDGGQSTVNDTPEDVTLGEVYRGVNGLRSDIQALSTRLDHVGRDHVRHDVYEADLRTVAAENAQTIARVAALEEGLQWLRRTVFAAVIPIIVLGFLTAIALYISKGVGP